MRSTIQHLDRTLTDKNQVWQVTASIRGKVQRVGFRYFVRTAASRLKLQGWVRNEDDGTVSLVAQGSKDQLRRLIDSLHVGPSLSFVKSVDIKWSSVQEPCTGFSIKS